MLKHTTSGMIVFTDSLKIKYKICRIDYTICDNDYFEYVFTPIYNVIDVLPKDEFQGIPGIDLSLRKTYYRRPNVVPVFISERSPSDHRIDKWDLLSEVNMNYLNRLEWMIRSNRTYFGDSLSVIRYENVINISDFHNISLNAHNYSREILSSIASGDDVYVDGIKINNSSKPTVCDLLRSIIKSDDRAKRQRAIMDGTQYGRKPIDVDSVSLIRVKRLMDQGLITSDQAAKELGVSKSTLYRLIKRYNPTNYQWRS